jgi:two-component system OmpR family response regulator/two-component system copper resistance phosphate regulon response regulator CusR
MSSRSSSERTQSGNDFADSLDDRSKTSMNVLVVEDDPVIGKSLSRGLSEAGHTCVWVKDGERGLESGLSHRFEAIVLDLLLPGIPGLEVLRQLRASGVRTPVLLLTALGAVDDRVAGLKAGADDYLPKPFAFPELMARLEAVCRRSVDRPTPIMTVGDLRIDLTKRRLHKGKDEIDLTPTEFSILELLMRHAGQVVTRKMLCEHLWDTDWEGTTNVIEVHVNRIRKKLDQEGSPSIIQTVRGRGYALRAS